MSEFKTKLAKLGWQLNHEQGPQVREVAGRKNAVSQVLVEEGVYQATKRHDNGNTLVEFTSDTPEGLLVQIEGWEDEQAISAQPPTELSKEAVESSDRATRLSLISASARDASNFPEK